MSKRLSRYSALGVTMGAAPKGCEHERVIRKAQKDSTTFATIFEGDGTKDQKIEAPPERAGLLLGRLDEEAKREGKTL